MRFLLNLFIIIASGAVAYGQTASVQESVVSNAFAGRNGSLVVIDCSSGATNTYELQIVAVRIVPCSTFKIWNALIGLETGIVSSSEQPFYKWDGPKRSIVAWNKDLTLKEAFQTSCVPAFQSLARQIGPERMQAWVDKIEYGDRDTSGGIDVFWLPAKGRKPILISPIEQAQLLSKLVMGKLPFSKTSLAVLKDLMMVRRTDKGTLFGKTGSGTDDRGTYVLGWFVGYVENGGKTHAFACAAQGENIMSKDAREIVEAVMESRGLL
jgi:beta-lactamase class D